jgi:hypothetical protein
MNKHHMVNWVTDNFIRMLKDARAELKDGTHTEAQLDMIDEAAKTIKKNAYELVDTIIEHKLTATVTHAHFRSLGWRGFGEDFAGETPVPVQLAWHAFIASIPAIQPFVSNELKPAIAPVVADGRGFDHVADADDRLTGGINERLEGTGQTKAVGDEPVGSGPDQGTASQEPTPAQTLAGVGETQQTPADQTPSAQVVLNEPANYVVMNTPDMQPVADKPVVMARDEEDLADEGGDVVDDDADGPQEGGDVIEDRASA